MREISAIRLREVLDYQPETGVFLWKARTAITNRVGEVAGTVDSRGYIRIGVDRHIYKAHRLAWLFVHGCLPDGEIDHINGVKSDNRIANLRDVSRMTNQQNQRASLSRQIGRHIGVTPHPATGKWRARIWHQGKNLSLGLHATQEDAHKAYLKAKRQLHEGCTI